MCNINTLRTIVKNGWTIANRRNIASQIGASNFDDIIDLANRANLRTSVKFPDVKDFLSINRTQQTKLDLENIINSYKEYAQSPYVNDYLRNGLSLSENAKRIIDALKLAISHNRISGRFVRGLSATRKNRLENIDDVSKFIFENKGFTSAVPQANSEYANCFSLGKNGVKAIFDVDNMPAYKASSYEVLFEPNAFTRDKFDITEIGDRLYRVSQLGK